LFFSDENLKELLKVDDEHECDKGIAIFSKIASLYSNENEIIKFWNKIPDEFKLQCLRSEDYYTIHILLKKGFVNTIDHMFLQIGENEQNIILKSLKDRKIEKYNDTSYEWMLSKLKKTIWRNTQQQGQNQRF